MGFGNITEILGVNRCENPISSCGKMDELSNGKDTMTGHWEMMGLKVDTPFPAFTDTGFPQELIDELKNIDNHKYGIQNFFELSPEPEVDYFFKRNGKQIPIYKLCRVAGTVIGKNDKVDLFIKTIIDINIIRLSVNAVASA